MPSNGRWGKKYNFKRADKSWIINLGERRNKGQYPIEADYIAYVLRKFYSGEALIPDEVLAPEQAELDETLRDICHWGFLVQSGKYLVCLRDVRKKGRPNYFEKDKEPLDLNEVRKICGGCIRGEEYDKELQGFRSMVFEVTKELENTIYTFPMWLCYSPEAGSFRFTFFRMGKMKCVERGEKKVSVDRICTKCEHVKRLSVPVPLTESPEVQNYFHRLEDLR